VEDKVKNVEESSLQVAQFLVEERRKEMNGLGLSRSFFRLKNSFFAVEV
jgi:hypothetical protein